MKDKVLRARVSPKFFRRAEREATLMKMDISTFVRWRLQEYFNELDFLRAQKAAK